MIKQFLISNVGIFVIVGGTILSTSVPFLLDKCNGEYRQNNGFFRCLADK